MMPNRWRGSLERSKHNADIVPEDSETGEDDISDGQGTQRLELRDDGAFSTPTGGSDTLVGTSLDTPPTSMTGTSEEQVSWWGSGQTVLEQEAGSRAGTRRLPGSPRQAQATGAGPRHLGVEPLVRASRANLVGASWGSEDSLSVASDLYGSAFSLYRGRALSIHVSVPQSGLHKEAIQECRSPVPPPTSEPPETRTKAPPGRKREPPPQAVRFLPWATPGQEGAAVPQTLEKNRAGPEAEKRLRRGPEEDGPWGAWDRRGARSQGRGRRARPTSPELESSDDSYVSAGEEPLEAPVFEIPLQNAVVAPGVDVLLKCIVTANPPPQGEL
ncbi:PREDICTED: striated muscle-specific serine/threonine-protein kinase-like [Bison bison bison]|uniref:Striated muscle-specific serine/threonine-protein kinase-like n=1 Tax=Bison bison bison TaxID=43346 RepID=A0A6P3J6T5_BISBB|nr:PREDICTED: striated muscle-specific serine/threonine-protein kinase-like [Bison bison bison]